MKPHATCLFVLILAGCGTRTLDDLSNATPPLATYNRDEKSCAAPVHSAPEDELRVRDSGEGNAVVELAFVNECTGLGGQYILSRAVDGSRYFWLGAHGCTTWETPPEAKFGVVRYAQTAALSNLPEGACLTLPGAPARITSDVTVRAVAVFATRSEAERFKSRL
jgi:hypothetical protein